jgi:D-alanine-D-alanine ligase
MLELNTQPGMTPTSLAPEQAEKIGISFDKLCRWIVEDASWPR